MDYKLIIFDFDGTLADTRRPIVLAKQKAMRELGLPVADESACAATIGLTAKLAFQQTYPDLPDEVIDQCVVLYRSYFEELMISSPPTLFPGVKEVLGELQSSGKILTIASSRQNKMLVELLRVLELDRFFTYILGGNDPLRLKPYPDAVIRTIEDHHLSPSETLVVGDMPYDILMGRNAGAATCGVTYGNADRETLLEAGADYIIDRMDLLPSVMQPCKSGRDLTR